MWTPATCILLPLSRTGLPGRGGEAGGEERGLSFTRPVSPRQRCNMDGAGGFCFLQAPLPEPCSSEGSKRCFFLSLYLSRQLLNQMKQFGLCGIQGFFLVKGKALFSGKQCYAFYFHQEKTGPLACGSGYSIARSCSRSMLALVESPSPAGPG